MNTVRKIKRSEKIFGNGETYFTCKNCSAYFNGESKKASERFDVTYEFCPNCFKELVDDEFIFECEECGKHFTKYALARGSREKYPEILCEKCFEDSYNICADCGTVVRYDKTFGPDYNENSYCQKCWEDDNTTDGMDLAKEAKLEEMGF